MTISRRDLLKASGLFALMPRIEDLLAPEDFVEEDDYQEDTSHYYDRLFDKELSSESFPSSCSCTGACMIGKCPAVRSRNTEENRT